jgi:hypothetical protein
MIRRQMSPHIPPAGGTTLPRMRAAALLQLTVMAAIAGCSSLSGDPAAPYTPSPLGAGLRLAQVQNPKSPDYQPCTAPDPDMCGTAFASSVVVTWLDTFDETMDGKSIGTLYIQDVGNPDAYAGIGCYETSFVPASLTPLPGDVLDFTGPYAESGNIGSAMFNKGTFLPQFYKPVGTFRYEFVPPPPLEINWADLAEDSSTPDGNFVHARQYMQMLVTVKNVTVAKGVSAAGGNGHRVTYLVENPDGGTTASNDVEISNELYNLQATDFPAGTTFSSVTGIVTWFYSFHIAPRSAADLVVAQ